MVLADEYVLPFSEVLDWQHFALRWPYSRAESLVPYLRTFSTSQVCEMRRRARAAWEQHFASEAKQVETLLSVLDSQWRAKAGKMRSVERFA